LNACTIKRSIIFFFAFSEREAFLKLKRSEKKYLSLRIFKFGYRNSYTSALSLRCKNKQRFFAKFKDIIDTSLEK